MSSLPARRDASPGTNVPWRAGSLRVSGSSDTRVMSRSGRYVSARPFPVRRSAAAPGPYSQSRPAGRPGRTGRVQGLLRPGLDVSPARTSTVSPPYSRPWISSTSSMARETGIRLRWNACLSSAGARDCLSRRPPCRFRGDPAGDLRLRLCPAIGKARLPPHPDLALECRFRTILDALPAQPEGPAVPAPGMSASLRTPPCRSSPAGSRPCARRLRSRCCVPDHVAVAHEARTSQCLRTILRNMIS